MKKIVLTACSLLVIGVTAWAQDTLTVRGNVKGDTEGLNKIYALGPGLTKDSAEIRNGAFELKIPFKEDMKPYFFSEYSLKKRKMEAPFTAVVDRPGVLSLQDFDITKEMRHARWTGIASAVDYQIFEDLRYAVKERFEKQSMSISQNSEPFRKAVAEALEQYLTKYSASPAAIYALEDNKNLLTPSQLSHMFQLLPAAQQESDQGRSLREFMLVLQASSVGSVVEDMVIEGVDAVDIRLQDYKGKYVLIDFWASWCGPCKQAFPHMKSIYEKYKGHDFEIVSISIDKDKEAWLKEYKKQILPWVNGLDKGDTAQKMLNITAVPTLFLLDPDGKILVKEIGLDLKGNGPIETTLQQVFKDRMKGS